MTLSSKNVVDLDGSILTVVHWKIREQLCYEADLNDSDTGFTLWMDR